VSPDKRAINAKKDPDGALQFVKERFADFLVLLEHNHKVLKLIADMEVKSHGPYLFDVNYIKETLKTMRQSIGVIIEKLINLGGEEYRPLLPRLAEIDSEIRSQLPGSRPIAEDDFVVPLYDLGRSRATGFGAKNAHLGELKSKLGLPVPAGFAISAWAYKYFIDANNLQERINRQIAQLDVKCYADLLQVSENIRKMITSAPLPRELADAIDSGFAELAQRALSSRFALRSSAIGEDSLYSFAGQYATFLNVTAAELHDRYKEVLAGKFTPQAIYYFLSHSLAESELAMSVGCLEMIDSRVSGVIYTRDPVNPDGDTMLVHSIYGLGKYLVDGSVTPDCFYVSRSGKGVSHVSLARKTRRLVLGSNSDTKVESVPPTEQHEPTLTPEQLS
jgi:pyruvate,water dikinase